MEIRKIAGVHNDPVLEAQRQKKALERIRQEAAKEVQKTDTGENRDDTVRDNSKNPKKGIIIDTSA